MKAIILILSLFVSFGSFGFETKMCSEYKIHLVENSNELAEVMGRLDFIDLPYMMKFKDDQKIKKGSLVVFESNDKKPMVIVGTLVSKDQYAYKLPHNGQISLKLNDIKSRKIASFSLCRRS